MVQWLKKLQFLIEVVMQKKTAVLIILIAVLLCGMRVQPAFCFSQQHFFSEIFGTKNQFSVHLPKIEPALKKISPSSKLPSVEILLGAGDVFARAA